MKNQEVLVKVRDLYMHFPVKGGFLGRTVATIKAVDGISFDIYRGEVLGLVGESGCGKTTTGRCILQLYKPTRGKIYFQEKDLGSLKPEELRGLRKHMQLIFEDPYFSLNPRMRVGDIIAEPLLIHKIADEEECRERVEELLTMVQLEPEMADHYPHEFSAGQRQRIEIARALALRPMFVVCDNPVSQLDVSIQTQIISLLMWFKGWLNLTYLFIAHDLAVVKSICDRILVMYAGKVMELAPRNMLYTNPLHPYTRALLSAVPVPDPEIEEKREIILLPGETPSPLNPPQGCRFQPRCKFADSTCKNTPPELKEIEKQHFVACHHIK
jgi:oligopeptide transport system ATP-binding protein